MAQQNQQETQQAQPSKWDRVMQFIEADQKKIGGTSLQAMGSLGLNELREVFSPGGNIAQPTPTGMYGNQTQAEVTNARGEGQQSNEASHRGTAGLGEAKGEKLTPSQIARGEFTPSDHQQHGRQHGQAGQEQQQHRGRGM